MLVGWHPLANRAGGAPPGLSCFLVHLGDAAVLQDHVAGDVQGHQVPQLLHEEAQHLASQLELVVAGKAVSGDVQVSGGWHFSRTVLIKYAYSSVFKLGLALALRDQNKTKRTC